MSDLMSARIFDRLSNEELARWLDNDANEMSGEPGRNNHVAAVRAAAERLRTTEETEWEYGLVSPDAVPGEYGRDDIAHLVSRNREHVERQHRRGHPSIRLMQRTTPGPWVPIPEGDNRG